MTANGERGASLLDRPVLAGRRITWWTVIYVALVIFILLTRFWDLGSRAYCHDESIHAWESWKLATGQGYVHSPIYHGPFGYHLTAATFLLFGHNDVTGRLPATLFGVALALLPWFLRRWLGRTGLLATTLIMAISPVMMHRARFFRHDQFNLVFNLILVILICHYLSRPKTWHLYAAAAVLALGYASKETTFITYAILGTFLFLQLIVEWRAKGWGDPRSLPVFDLVVVIGTLSLPLATPFPVALLGGDPIDYSARGIMFSTALLLVMQGIAAGIGVWWDWRRWLTAVGIFYALFATLFTTLFTNGLGLATGLMGSLGYWLSQHGEQRGGQPLHYYVVLTTLYEFLPALLALAGTVYYALRGEGAPPGGALDEKGLGEEDSGARRADEEQEPAVEADPATALRAAGLASEGARRVPFVLLLVWWAWTAFAGYSWAGEKMPWLMLQIVVPMHLLAGWTLGRLLEADWRSLRARGALWLLLVLPLLAYALLRLLALSPSRDTTLEALNETMAWVAALLVAAALAGLVYRLARRLQRSERWRVVALAAVVVLAAATVRFAWMATYINADSAAEFLVYAQGAPDTAVVTRELEDMSQRLTGGMDLRVAYDDRSSWPFVWYLRNFSNAQFYGSRPAGPLDADVVIVGSDNEAGVRPLLGNRYYRRQYRLVWWPLQSWYMEMTPASLWRDLTDADGRRRLVDVVWHRRYEVPLSNWPYVANFALYVRRDVAQQLWDYGPEVVLAPQTLPGDEYVLRWEPRTALEAWGGLGEEPGRLHNPKGLAIDGAGNLYVADSQNHRVQVFDPAGRMVRAWGQQGPTAGSFNEPWGLAVAPNGDVYVADTWNHRIQVFDADGTLVRTWGRFGQTDASGPGDLLYGPRDVAIGPDGSVYVSDTGNKRVLRYAPDGRLLAAVGGPGAEAGRLEEPVGLAVGPDGTLYVADTWNRRIQAFDQDLRYLREWPVHGWEGMSVLNKPYLAVDGAGNVLATDPENHRLLHFDRTGVLLAVWGQFGSDLSSLNLPTGIAVSAAGKVFVADSHNQRLLVYGPH